LEEPVTVTVVSPMGMKTFPGIATRRDFYRVLKHPAPLAGMAYPSSSPWQTLASEGFKSVVCLTDALARYDPKPLDVLRAAKFKDLYGGAYPDEPAREQSVLREIATAVTSEILLGRGVVVHCEGGTGRTGTVIACTLRALGLPLSEVLDYMKQLNAARSKRPDWKGWPESDWQSEQVKQWSAS
jgi:protein-tyrosine phosphatase